MSTDERTPADEAALGLDPARIVSEHRERVRKALDADPDPDCDDATREAVETYADVEERVLFDVADRVVPAASEDLARARDGRERVLDALADRRRRGAVRELFDRHVRETESLFRALWDHLDDDAAARVAAALEEARLSREEVDPPVPARRGESRTPPGSSPDPHTRAPTTGDRR